MNKATLRKNFLDKRLALSQVEIAATTDDISRQFFSEVDLSDVQILHTFIRIPKFNEIDTSKIYRRLWREHPKVLTCAPRTNLITTQIESFSFGSNTLIIENAWGIPEPAGGKVIEPGEIDIVLVPLLCFDKQGYRVGYGKGFYDKFLAQCRPDCRKVGLSIFPPVDRIDDVHTGDIPLDEFVTPSGIFSNSI